MQNETKICQNCKKDFVIESEDFSFYEKIKVSPPTFCPECRLLRRMLATNERFLYKRKCDLTGKDIFSMYNKDTVFPVYDLDVWYSDAWDPYSYGMDFDPSRPFFEQFLELQNKVPRMSLVRQMDAVNSPFTHRVTAPKNSFMVFRSSYPEDCMYIYNANSPRSSCDCSWLIKSELCYECVNCQNSYNMRFSVDTNDSRDSSFLYACRNCSNCVGCVNLLNREYCIWNEQYTKEKYFEKIKELELNSHSGLEKMKIKFEEFRKRFPQKGVNAIKSTNVSGNWLTNCMNVHQSFNCEEVKDGKYLLMVFKAQDCMDYFEWGNKAELVYESENCGLDISRIFFSTQCWSGANDLYYCNTCVGSQHCLGCVGLKKGEYSILNKRYSKEEYEKLKNQIIQQMKEVPYYDGDKKYLFGEHFPNSFSDFAYNETGAYEYFPLAKKEALDKGYKWKEREKKNYQVTKKSVDLSDTIAEVDDSILNEIIECEDKENPHSVGAFRITPNELSFYRRMDLPLPRACFDVRHIRRFQKRPKLQSQRRECSKCDLEINTVYDAPKYPIIYCENCYKQEIY